MSATASDVGDADRLARVNAQLRYRAPGRPPRHRAGQRARGKQGPRLPRGHRHARSGRGREQFLILRSLFRTQATSYYHLSDEGRALDSMVAKGG